ncbi:alpha/beta hydrolase [Candidatus Saccharibacteria bacterium]|nr:alpha/beta hydrolase [Candidatus Saccharibacteria bacterium]
MKNAILLHGKPGKEEYYDPQFPSASNYHWFPWLQKQLIVNDIKADTPEVPLAYDPQWELWVKEVERYEFTPETILVGHSCGGGFWTRYLSERKDLRVGKVVLVAPSLGYSGWGDKFFEDFTMDTELVSRTGGITIFNSDNDDEGIQRAVKEIRQKIPGIEYREFHLGHFTANDMQTSEFPELLDECLR